MDESSKILFWLIVGLTILFINIYEHKKQKLETEIRKLKTELSSEKSMLDNLLNSKNQKINELQHSIQETKNTANCLRGEKDFYLKKLTEREKFPEREEFWGAQFLRASEKIKSLEAENKELKYQLQIAQNNIDIEIVEKLQAQLDEYREQRTKVQIGRDYELYTSWRYRQMGYKVIENGVSKGFEDGGIDLIAENEKEILIIQCKYWAKSELIHQDIIHKLHGATAQYAAEHGIDTNRIFGVLVTNHSVAKDAWQSAKSLGIRLEQNQKLKPFPCIKCKRTEPRYYYRLPFDETYDQLQVNITLGDMWLNTVMEAEIAGFRRKP